MSDDLKSLNGKQYKQFKKISKSIALLHEVRNTITKRMIVTCYHCKGAGMHDHTSIYCIVECGPCNGAGVVCAYCGMSANHCQCGEGL